MGFWHTGYMEFHEPVGLDIEFERAPTLYACQYCAATFTSRDALLTHRFESHPFFRPSLFVRGEELGNLPVVLTTPLQPNEVVLKQYESVRLNGDTVSPTELAQRLSKLTNDKVSIRADNHGVTANFEIVFAVAKASDLRGVEQAFLKMAAERHLDARAIESFISSSRAFATADAYCDGICHYLYGVLAKERAESSTLPYASYIERFNQAADTLKRFDRALARVIRSLIAFHFNQFIDAAQLYPKSRIGLAAIRFDVWISGRPHLADLKSTDEPLASAEELLTDLETLRILRWALAPPTSLKQCIREMEEHYRQADMTEYDRAKLVVRLAEAYVYMGDVSSARQIAHEVINNPILGRWAERIGQHARSKSSNDD